MTNAGPGPSPDDGPQGAMPTVDWASLIGDLGTFGQQVVKRFADKATDVAEHARAGTYDRNRWLEDVEWFWKNLGDDAVHTIEMCRSKLSGP